MLSVNKSLYPTCTVPADARTFKRHEHQLAIADAKAQVSLDHMKMHDKLIVRRQWTASAVLNSHGYGQPVVDSQRTTEQYGNGRTHGITTSLHHHWCHHAQGRLTKFTFRYEMYYWALHGK